MRRYMSDIEDMFERQLVQNGVGEWRPWIKTESIYINNLYALYRSTHYSVGL